MIFHKKLTLPLSFKESGRQWTCQRKWSQNFFWYISTLWWITGIYFKISLRWNHLVSILHCFQLCFFSISSPLSPFSRPSWFRSVHIPAEGYWTLLRLSYVVVLNPTKNFKISQCPCCTDQLKTSWCEHRYQSVF